MSDRPNPNSIARRVVVGIGLVCVFGGACTPTPYSEGPSGSGCVVAYDDNVWCNWVSYGSGASQNGQIVRSLAPGLHPVIIVVHGGSWTQGNFDPGTVPPLLPGSAFHDGPVPSPISTWLMDRVASGYGLFAINHRMASPDVPGTQAPGAVLDVKLAVRWVKQTGALYGLDPARVTLLGTSSGGHLAVTAASTIGVEGWEPTEIPEQTSTVESVVSLAGIFDFSAELLDPRNVNPLDIASAAMFLGCSIPGGFVPPDPCTDLATTPASPVNNVSSPGFHIPSLFLVTAGRAGPGDQWVSSAQYASYAAALTAAGHPFEDCDDPVGNHFQFDYCMPELNAWLDALP